MPQDGSNNYQYPPGTPGIPDQTIQSESYNTFLDDLVHNDLNIPRPITRGGTGASDSTQALVNLGGEKSSQVVTNYDTQVFLSGSFYSAAGATNAPVAGHAFVGIAYVSDAPAAPPANLNLVIEARDQNDTSVPGKLYVREKKAGVWGPWQGDTSLNVGSLPPNGAPAGALWWDSDNGVLYVNYKDVDTTQWVQAVALPAVDTSLFVKKSGDTMAGLLTLSGDPTAILHAATKQYVDGGVGGVGGGLLAKVDKAGGTGGIMTGLLTLSADPTAVLHAATKQYVDAGDVAGLAAAGMQINGGMEVSQERGLTATSVTNSFICDGWRLINTAAVAVVSGSIAPTNNFVPGFTSHMQIAVTTAQASLSGSEQVGVLHRIEGYRAIRVGFGAAYAQPITIAFQTAHGRTGVYSVSIRNSDDSRSYTATYTQNASSTWEFKTITVPGDVAGTWLRDNSPGISVHFMVACGPTLTAPSANTWYGVTYVAAPGQVNAVATTSDFFRITGVTVLPGTQAPTAAQSPLLMRSFDQELALCQRYWFKSYSYGIAPGTALVDGGSTLYIAGTPPGPYFCGAFLFPVAMRAAPTITMYNNVGTAGSMSYFASGWAHGGGGTAAGMTTSGVGIFASSGGIAAMYNFDIVANARL